MSLFGKSSTNVALLDVRSSSVAAGYATLRRDGPPTLVYATRVPLEPHATEPLEEAFARTLELVLHDLVTEGAPILRKTSGSGNADRMLVTLAAPWQSSNVFSREIVKDKPFTFTKQTLAEAVNVPYALPEGWTRVKDMLMATLLNGYEVANPFGKRVKRADLIMLTSAIDTTMMESLTVSLRKALHQHHIDFDAFIPDAYEVFRDLYPHQRDFMALDIGSEATDVLLAKHGFLVSATSIPHGTAEIARAARRISAPAARSAEPLIDTSRNTEFGTKMDEAERQWVGEIATALGEIARVEPLPRTVFLFAEEGVRDFLKNLLDTPQMRALWLSDEALAILPVVPGQFTPFLAKGSVDPVDPALAILALAAQKRFG